MAWYECSYMYDMSALCVVKWCVDGFLNDTEIKKKLSNLTLEPTGGEPYLYFWYTYIQNDTILCYDMLCYAVLYYAMLCYVV